VDVYGTQYILSDVVKSSDGQISNQTSVPNLESNLKPPLPQSQIIFAQIYNDIVSNHNFNHIQNSESQKFLLDENSVRQTVTPKQLY